MSPPYFSSEFTVYIRYLPTVRGLSGPGSVARSAPYSHVANSVETDAFLEKLEAFDPRLKRGIRGSKANVSFTGSDEACSVLDEESVNRPSIATVSELSVVSSRLSVDAECSRRDIKGSMTPTSVEEGELRSFEDVSEKDGYLRRLRQFVFNKSCFRIGSKVIGTTRKFSIMLICIKSLVQVD